MIDNITNNLNQLDVILKNLDEKCKYSTICKMDNEDLVIYRKKLDAFKAVNNSKTKTAIKGKILEDLVSFLLEVSGGLFEVKENIRTNTNELDQVLKLTVKGKVLKSHDLINNRLELFIGECKNYNKSVSVTYVGKFCCLLQTLNIKFGIIFSYHGVSGAGWTNGSGLIKKFYMCREDDNQRFCIIDFDYKDFESILQGNNLLQIIDDKLDALRLDTSYINLLSKHPAEEEIKNIIYDY